MARAGRALNVLSAAHLGMEDTALWTVATHGRLSVRTPGLRLRTGFYSRDTSYGIARVCRL